MSKMWSSSRSVHFSYGSGQLIRWLQLLQKLGIEVSTERKGEAEGWPCPQQWTCGCQGSFAGRYFLGALLWRAEHLDLARLTVLQLLSNLACTLWVERLSPSLEREEVGHSELRRRRQSSSPLPWDLPTHTSHALASAVPPLPIYFALLPDWGEICKFTGKLKGTRGQRSSSAHFLLADILYQKQYWYFLTQIGFCDCYWVFKT